MEDMEDQASIIDVTTDNAEAVLPSILEQIENADFIAMDQVSMIDNWIFTLLHFLSVTSLKPVRWLLCNFKQIYILIIGSNTSSLRGFTWKTYQ